MFGKQTKVNNSLIDTTKGMVELIQSEKIRTDFHNKINSVEIEYTNAEHLERLKNHNKQYELQLCKDIVEQAIVEYNINFYNGRSLLTLNEVYDDLYNRENRDRIFIIIKHDYSNRIMVLCSEKDKHLAYREILIKISQFGIKHYTNRKELINNEIVDVWGETLTLKI